MKKKLIIAIGWMLMYFAFIYVSSFENFELLTLLNLKIFYRTKDDKTLLRIRYVEHKRRHFFRYFKCFYLFYLLKLSYLFAYQHFFSCLSVLSLLISHSFNCQIFIQTRRRSMVYVYLHSLSWIVRKVQS